MAGEDLSITQFCEMADVEAETVHAILGKKMPFSVEQLDRVTYGMRLNPGHFYGHYIEEYWVEAVPHWRNIKPFLYRCEELNKLDCIQQISYLELNSTADVQNDWPCASIACLFLGWGPIKNKTSTLLTGFFHFWISLMTSTDSTH